MSNYPKNVQDFLIKHLGIYEDKLVLAKRLDSNWQRSLKKKDIIGYDEWNYIWYVNNLDKMVEEYINAAADVLLNDHLVNIEEIINHDDSEDDEATAVSTEWDLFFCPAKNQGFEEVFLGKNQWYSVRIASWRIPQIKYISCYRGAPYSAITHYAKVKEIKPYGDGKYIIYFDGEAIPLENSVVLGKSNVMNIRKIRYTSLEKLKNATEVSLSFWSRSVFLA